MIQSDKEKSKHKCIKGIGQNILTSTHQNIVVLKKQLKRCILPIVGMVQKKFYYNSSSGRPIAKLKNLLLNEHTVGVGDEDIE